jgi:NADH-quinone oxidoreductase subunit M
VLAAAYLLWLYQRVFFGPVTNPKNEKLHDLTPREVATFVPLLIMAFWIGLYPKPFFQILEQPVNHLAATFNRETPKAETTASVAGGAAAPSECAGCGSSAMPSPAAVNTGTPAAIQPVTRTTPAPAPAKGKN